MYQHMAAPARFVKMASGRFAESSHIGRYSARSVFEKQGIEIGEGCKGATSLFTQGQAKNIRRYSDNSIIDVKTARSEYALKLFNPLRNDEARLDIRDKNGNTIVKNTYIKLNPSTKTTNLKTAIQEEISRLHEDEASLQRERKHESVAS